MWRPQISASSPVFTMTVRSRGSMIRERPRSSLAAPVPPASAVSFMARGAAGQCSPRARAEREPPRPAVLQRAVPPRQPNNPSPGRPWNSRGSSASGIGMNPLRTQTRSRLWGRAKMVVMPAGPACASTWFASSAATASTSSVGVSGGATTTGPCSIAVAPARSIRTAPTSRSPSQAPQPASTSAGGGVQAPVNRNSSRACSRDAGSGRYSRAPCVLLLAKHRILEGLGEPELHHALGRDLDGLAGLRVAPHPCLAVRQHEAAEVRHHEDVLGFLGREAEELVHDVDDLLLAERRLLGQVSDDGGLRHRFCHVLPSMFECESERSGRWG